jgi:hypothetical protein
MARWYAIATHKEGPDVIVGEVTAPDYNTAMTFARRVWKTGFNRIQSVLSYDIESHEPKKTDEDKWDL